MSAVTLEITTAETGSSEPDSLDGLNALLESQSAEQRVQWALQNGAPGFALSSSFGAQAAVMLHLVTQQKPDIPVILIDTGYLLSLIHI